jgi:toxin CcdB
MAQFDVFTNPIESARRAYPFVVILQADFAQNARDQIVAPLVPRDSMGSVAGRLTPVVALNNSQYVVVVPAISGVRLRDLRDRVGSLSVVRPELLAAIDYLFFGV